MLLKTSTNDAAPANDVYLSKSNRVMRMTGRSGGIDGVCHDEVNDDVEEVFVVSVGGDTGTIERKREGALRVIQSFESSSPPLLNGGVIVSASVVGTTVSLFIVAAAAASGGGGCIIATHSCKRSVNSMN